MDELHNMTFDYQNDKNYNVYTHVITNGLQRLKQHDDR